MSLYSYTARRSNGEIVTGEISASSLDQLRRNLLRDGILLADAKVKARNWGRLQIARPVKTSAMLAFLREYQSLEGAALPTTQILTLLSNRQDSPSLGAAIAGVRDLVEKGKSLADAMAEFPDAFDPLTQATFRVGGQTGNMAAALAQLENFVALRHELQRNMRRAMTYPIFLLALLFVVLSGLMLFVLPRFALLYEEFDAQLPLATRILMQGVQYAPIWIPAILIAGVGMWSLARIWNRSAKIRMAVDRLKIRMPISGGVLKNIMNVQICHMMSLLLRSGVQLPEAIRLTAASLSNREVSQKLMTVQRDVSTGKSFTDALALASIFPATSLSLLRAGEISGDLDRMFSAVSVMHEQQLQDQMGRLLALIEPAMMLLVGLVLGTVIIAVYLPIFGLSAVVR